MCSPTGQICCDNDCVDGDCCNNNDCEFGSLCYNNDCTPVQETICTTLTFDLLAQVVRYCRNRGGCSVGSKSDYQGITAYDLTQSGYDPRIGYASYASANVDKIRCTTSSGDCCDYSGCPYECSSTQIQHTKMLITFNVDNTRCTIEIGIPMRPAESGSCNSLKRIRTYTPSRIKSLDWFGTVYTSSSLIANAPDIEQGAFKCNFSDQMSTSDQVCFARLISLTD